MRIFEFSNSVHFNVYIEGIPLYFQVCDIESYFNSMLNYCSFSLPIRSGETTYSLTLTMEKKSDFDIILNNRRSIISELQNPSSMAKRKEGEASTPHKLLERFVLELDVYQEAGTPASLKALLQGLIEHPTDLDVKRKRVGMASNNPKASYYLFTRDPKTYLFLLSSRTLKPTSSMHLSVKILSSSKKRIKKERAVCKLLFRKTQSQRKFTPLINNIENLPAVKTKNGTVNHQHEKQSIFKIKQDVKYQCSIKYQGTIYRKSISEQKNWGFK